MLHILQHFTIPMQQKEKNSFNAVSSSRFNSILKTVICFGLSIATLQATTKSPGVP